MARTVYDNQRVFTAEVKAGKIERDSELPYAIMITSTKDSQGRTDHTKAKTIALLESDFPFFVTSETFQDRYHDVGTQQYVYYERTNYDIAVYSRERKQGSDTYFDLGLKASVRMYGYAEGYYNFEGTGFYQIMKLPFKVTPRKYNFIEIQSSDDSVLRQDGCEEGGLSSIARMHTKTSGKYYPVVTDYAYISIKLTGAGNFSDTHLWTFDRTLSFSSDKHETHIYNVDNPVFESGDEWYAWCKEHDNG